MYDHSNGSNPKIKLKNLSGNEIMNWMRHFGTLKFSTPHINSTLVETWEAFKLPSATITQKYFKKTHTPPLSPPYIVTNHQACLAGTQNSNREKAGDIGRRAKANIAPIDMEEFRTTDPSFILR